MSRGLGPQSLLAALAEIRAALPWRDVGYSGKRSVSWASPLSPTVVRLAMGDGHQVDTDLVPALVNELGRRDPMVIVFDDMLPREVAEASRGGNPIAWAGDVYKTSLALLEYRPDLLLMPVDTEPTGVLVVLGADPTNRVLHDRYDDIVARWTAEDPQDVPESILRRTGAYDPERLVRRQGRGEHPDLPVAADAMLLPVGPDRAVSARRDDVGESLCEERVGVVGRGAEIAVARVRLQLAPRRIAPQFGVRPEV